MPEAPLRKLVSQPKGTSAAATLRRRVDSHEAKRGEPFLRVAGLMAASAIGTGSVGGERRG